MVRAALAPLVRGATYRRGVYLLLGGVVALPYALLALVFTRMLTTPGTPRAATLLLLAVAAVIGVVPAFLRGTRALEIAAARGLLDVDLPDPPASVESARVMRETRLRAALWFTVHLAIGGALWLALLFALPMALVFIAHQFGIVGDALAGLRIGPLDEHDAVWLSLVGCIVLVVVVYAVAGLGALAALMAPVLLGPSPTERIAALEARAVHLAERNRLARELHDSVGHALTVTTLKAAAANQLLDTDPAFVRRALTAIENAGRAAIEDLDHVLGVLRERGDAGYAPRRTLADLDRLVADARATGVMVELDLTGDPADLPAAVSREGYRIVQEGLTNAPRHAGRVPTTLRVRVTDVGLDIDLANPLPERREVADGGRGLEGIRERVTLLGGSLAVGPDGEAWRMSVRLPAAGR